MQPSAPVPELCRSLQHWMPWLSWDTSGGLGHHCAGNWISFLLLAFVSAFDLPFIKPSIVSVTKGTRFVMGFHFLDGKTIICVIHEKMQYTQLTSNYLPLVHPCSRLQQTPWQTTRHSSFYFMGNKEKYSNATRRVRWCPYSQPLARFSPSSN